jgi:3-oxoacyl-[acyl-carrier protein] reductase
MQNLEGKIALITGGSGGIGFGIAEALVREGVRVAITGRTQTTVEGAAARLGKDRALGLVADVRDAASQRKAVARLLDTWGNLDVLVANAGLGHFGSIESMTTEQWSETIDTNLTGVFHSIQACLPALKKSKGYVMTIASLAGTNFFAGGSAYNASKFGLVGFTQAVMLDLRACGISVTTLMPGSVATHFNDHVPNPSDDWKIQPEDIGQVVVDVLKLNRRTLPSKIEIRPSQPK